MPWFRRSLGEWFRLPSQNGLTKRRSRLLRSELVRLDDRIVPAADLSVSVDAFTSPVIAGNSVQFTYTITNTGVDDAADVTLSELLPAGFTFVSISQNPDPLNPQFTLDADADNSVTSSVALFPAGKTAQVTVTAKVNANVPDGTTLSRDIEVTTSTADSDLTNNLKSVDVDVIAVSDLGITVTGPTSAASGTQLTYLVTIQNNGTSDAQAVNFASVFSSKLSFVSKAKLSGSSLPGVIPANGSSVYEFKVNVAANAPDGDQSIQFDVNSTTTDNNVANDDSLVTIAVESQSLAVSKAGSVITISDAVGRANELSISRVGGSIVITDAAERFQNPGFGVLSNGNKTLTISAAGVTSIAVNSGAGDDQLTVDTTSALLGLGVTFDGGTEEDDLIVFGGVQAAVTSTLISGSAGIVSLGGVNSIAYSGLEPVLLNFGSGTNYIFNLPAGASQAVLEDDGVVANGLSQLRSANFSFETTSFANTTGSVTINRGNALDTLQITSLPDYSGGIAIGSSGKPLAQINLDSPFSTTQSVALVATTIGLQAALSADNGLSLEATTVTQGVAAPLSTPAILTLGAVGNAGIYTLTNTGNDIGTLESKGSGQINFHDTNTVTLGNVTTSNSLTVSSDESLSLSGILTTGASTTLSSLTKISVLASQSLTQNTSLNAGDEIFVAAGVTVNVSAGQSLTLTVDQIGAIDATGGQVSFAGANLIAPGGVTINGGSGNDTFLISKVTAAISLNGNLPIAGDPSVPPGDTLIIDGESGTYAYNKLAVNQFRIGTGGTLTYSSIESQIYQGFTTYNVTGTNGADQLILNTNGLNQPQYQLIGNPVVVLPAGITTFGFDGGLGDDRMTAVLKTDGTLPIATVKYDGQGDNDGLIINANSQSVDVNLTPVAGNQGLGVVSAGSSTLSFTHIEPIDLFNSNDATVTFNGSKQSININPGKDFFQGGGTDAIIISGTSDTLPFETIAAWGNTALTINAISGVPGDDVVSIAGTGAAAAHGNKSLTISTDNTVNSQVMTSGIVDVLEDLSITSKAVIINGVTTAGGSITLAGSQTVTTTQAVTSTGGNVTINGGTIQLDGTTTGEAVSITGSSSIVTTASVQSTLGDVSLSAPTITLNGTVNSANDVAVTGTTIDIQNDVAASQKIEILNTGTLSLSNVIFDAGSTFRQSDGPVAIANSKTVTVNAGGTVAFGGLVNGPGRLIVNTSSDATFSKNVGTSPLNSLTTNIGGSTIFNGSFTKTVANQTYGDTVVFSIDGFRFESSAGSLQFDGSLNPTASGLNVTTQAATGNITHTGAIGNATLPVGQYSIETAVNVSINDFTGDRLLQIAGTGTTSLIANGLVTATGNQPGAADFKSGGAINLSTKQAILSGGIQALNGPIVLQLTNGATQPSGMLSTTQLYLTGAGPFQLDRDGNQLSAGNDVANVGEVFASLTNGPLSISDSSTLRLNFFNEAAPTPAITINGGANRSATFWAKGSLLVAPTTVSPDTTLFNVTNTGTIQFYFNTATAGSAQFLTQATAQSVTLGLPLASRNDATKTQYQNKFNDQFVVRPQINSSLQLNGFDPDQTPTGDSLIINLDGIPVANFTPLGAGSGFYTFPVTYQKLQFESIEEIGGRQAQAFTVQTGPNSQNPQPQIEIRLRYFTSNSSSQTNITGNRVSSNAFVVTPSRIDPSKPYGAPTVTFAYISNQRGKGSPDLVIASGSNDRPLITIIRANKLESSGITSATLDISKLTPDQILAQFVPFESTFYGGFSIATADFDNDDRDELIIGAGQSGGPRIAVFQITNSNASIFSKNGREYNFFPYEESFRGGVNVAAADINKDGTPDVIAGAGFGGAARVRVFDGSSAPAWDPVSQQTIGIADFFAYDSNYRGGVLVTGGQFDASGFDQLITAPGSGGGPHIKIFQDINGNELTLKNQFFAWKAGNTLIPSESRYQTGIGSFALGTSANNGLERELLVTRPRGQEFEIVRFSTQSTPGAVDIGGIFMTSHYETIINAGLASIPFTTLFDSGSVGGISNA